MGRRRRPPREEEHTQMTDAATTTDANGLFASGAPWADMDAWHQAVAEIRRETPVLRLEGPGISPYWVLTRHEDVFAVSRDAEHWKNTVRSVLGPDADFEQMRASGLEPRTLVHLDDHAHTVHRQVTNDWFKPAAVGHRQPRIDAIAEQFIDRMRV